MDPVTIAALAIQILQLVAKTEPKVAEAIAAWKSSGDPTVTDLDALLQRVNGLDLGPLPS